MLGRHHVCKRSRAHDISEFYVCHSWCLPVSAGARGQVCRCEGDGSGSGVGDMGVGGICSTGLGAICSTGLGAICSTGLHDGRRMSAATAMDTEETGLAHERGTGRAVGASGVRQSDV